VVVRTGDDRFEVDRDGDRLAVPALGHDTFRSTLVLTPLCDQHGDVTSRYVFHRAHVDGGGVTRRLVSDPPPAAIHA
jgi:hypothetical protein